LGGLVQNAKIIARTDFIFEEGVSVVVDGVNLAAVVVRRQAQRELRAVGA
jgi:hypothetical protein